MELYVSREHYDHETLGYGVPGRHPIRLLKIPPGDSENPVSCELFRTYINTNSEEESASPSREDQTLHERNPTYIALSYMRGDAMVTVPIQVNGKVHRLTTNLRVALKRHRDTFLQGPTI